MYCSINKWGLIFSHRGSPVATSICCYSVLLSKSLSGSYYLSAVTKNYYSCKYNSFQDKKGKVSFLIARLCFLYVH